MQVQVQVQVKSGKSKLIDSLTCVPDKDDSINIDNDYCSAIPTPSYLRYSQRGYIA